MKHLLHLVALGCSLGCCLQSSLLQAQSAAELRYLVFDPVPIAATQAEDGTLQVDELASLPREAPVLLQQWLRTNRPVLPEPLESLEDSIKRNEQLLQEIELNDGPFSAQLPQQLLSLGAALQASGDFEKAQDHFEQAMHVTRVNHGLFSEAQIPFVKYSIDNQLRRGNLLAADEKQRYLFYLNQKNHGGNSAALLPALQDFAEWNIFAFSAPVSAPAFSLTDDSEAEKASPVDEAMFRVERLINAQHIYWSIAQILVANFGMTDPRLLDTEKHIALTNYFFATTVATDAETMNLSTANVPAAAPTTGLGSAQMLGNMGYRQGRDALERRRNYMYEMDSMSAEERLRASLDVNDWMLYFSRQRMKAIEMYSSDHAQFAETMSPAALEAILNPPVPVQLPSFINPAWSRASLGLPDDQALQYKGHIDVEFSLSRFGRATAVSVLGRSSPEAKLVEQRLLRSLRRAQFRPRFENGQLKLDDTAQVRYYYTW
jgi:tetratricopeptide (TPR) repeat protein